MSLTIPGDTIVVWKKEKIPLNSSDDYIIKNCVSPETSTVSSTLAIDSVTSKDESTYSCYAILNKAMVTWRQSVLTDTSYFHQHTEKEEGSMCTWWYLCIVHECTGMGPSYARTWVVTSLKSYLAPYLAGLEFGELKELYSLIYIVQ